MIVTSTLMADVGIARFHQPQIPRQSHALRYPRQTMCCSRLHILHPVLRLGESIKATSSKSTKSHRLLSIFHVQYSFHMDSIWEARTRPIKELSMYLHAVIGTGIHVAGWRTNSYQMPSIGWLLSDGFYRFDLSCDTWPNIMGQGLRLSKQPSVAQLSR